MALFRPATIVHAHCDLFCGVYDPAQAMIEARSVLNACTKYADSDDPVFRDRCVLIKEQQAELVKHHLSVLWSDFSSLITLSASRSCMICSGGRSKRPAMPKSLWTRLSLRGSWI